MLISTRGAFSREEEERHALHTLGLDILSPWAQTKMFYRIGRDLNLLNVGFIVEEISRGI